jgi:hypothetical protein
MRFEPDKVRNLIRPVIRTLRTRESLRLTLSVLCRRLLKLRMKYRFANVIRIRKNVIIE